MPPRSMKAPYSVRFLTTPVTTEPSSRCVEGGALALVDFFFDGELARDHHVAAAPIQLDDLDRHILADQGVQVAHRTRIGLRSRHESLDAHVHRQAAFDAAQHAAGDDELLLVGLFEVVPNAQPGGPRMGEQDVSFNLLAMVDHHVHDVAGPDGDFAARTLKLLDRNEAFGLVSEIDDDVFGGQAENGSLQYLIGGGRREMAVVVEQFFVAVRRCLVQLRVILLVGH